MKNRIRSTNTKTGIAVAHTNQRTLAFCLLVGTLIAQFLAGCKALDHPTPAVRTPSGMAVKKTPLLLANPWIEAEIRQFLGQPEVSDVFGFEPLSYENSFTLTLLEQRMSDQGIFRLFGMSANRDVYIQSSLFIDDGSAGRKRGSIDQDPDAARRASMLESLAADPQMLMLYRNLLTCHEVAHVVEWYALSQRQEVVRYTGHGISDRIEIRILTRLLQTGKVRPEVYAKIFFFYATFLNQDAEPAADVARYYRQALSSFGNLSSDRIGGTLPDYLRPGSAYPP